MQNFRSIGQELGKIFTGKDDGSIRTFFWKKGQKVNFDEIIYEENGVFLSVNFAVRRNLWVERDTHFLRKKT